MASGRQRRRRPFGLSVRRATLKDLDVLVRQRRAMWIDLGVRGQAAHDRGDHAYRRWAQSRMRKNLLFAWIAENRFGEVAGGGCLWLQPVQPMPQRKGELQPYLLSMYTEPKFRQKGVASMIVLEAIEWCRRRGFERLRLHASEMGRSVYKGLGFKRAWEMRLDIDKPQPNKARRRRNVIQKAVHA